MMSGDLLADLGPVARTFIAVTPVAYAIGLRLLLGHNKFTRFLLSVSTCWLLLSVLTAPSSQRVRQDLFGLPAWFR